MNNRVLQLDPRDNVLIALSNLGKGETVTFGGESYVLGSDVRAKHKFATEDFATGADIIMYGVLVGKAVAPIRRGELLSTRNVHHEAAPFRDKLREYTWTPPDVSKWQQKTFRGYRRSDGQVGTRNYWVVVPLVFCENRNIGVLKQAFEEELIVSRWRSWRDSTRKAAPTNSRSDTQREKTWRPGVRRCLKTWTASAFCCMKAVAGEREKTPTIFAG